MVASPVEVTPFCFSALQAANQLPDLWLCYFAWVCLPYKMFLIASAVQCLCCLPTCDDDWLSVSSGYVVKFHSRCQLVGTSPFSFPSMQLLITTIVKQHGAPVNFHPYTRFQSLYLRPTKLTCPGREYSILPLVNPFGQKLVLINSRYCYL